MWIWINEIRNEIEMTFKGKHPGEGWPHARTYRPPKKIFWKFGTFRYDSATTSFCSIIRFDDGRHSSLYGQVGWVFELHTTWKLQTASSSGYTALPFNPREQASSVGFVDWQVFNGNAIDEPNSNSLRSCPCWWTTKPICTTFFPIQQTSPKREVSSHK